MKRTLLAAALISLAQPGWTQLAAINFDGGLPKADFGAPKFQFKRAPVTAAEATPETRAIKAVKAGIVEILITVKWADVADADLPLDTSKVPDEAKALMELMSPAELKAFVKKMKIPKVSRDKLPEYSAVGSGTGFIVKLTDGRTVCLTNAHVANSAKEVEKKSKLKTELHIKLSDDPFAHIPTADDMTAQVAAVGKRGMDVAVLTIPAQQKGGKAWQPLALGDSASVEEGEAVWAMGFPMGLNYTTTHGIVSAVHVTLDSPYVHYVQTDAAINPGNSGGPLVRIEKGQVEVIAMNTQILSQSGGSNGLGFAIEADTIKRALGLYQRSGSIDVGYVGMAFGMGPSKSTIAVQSVAKGGPAEKAGLKAGDVVKSVDGKDVASNAEVAMFQISQSVKSKDPGEKIQLVVTRGGKDVSITIAVEKEPENVAGVHAAESEDDGQ